MLKERHENPLILIVGAGAVGGLYGAILQKQGADVSVVCRTDYERVAEEGIQVDSHTLGVMQLSPTHTLKRAEQYPDFPEYLFLCVKIVDGLDRAELIRTVVGPDTVIVLLQNGIDIEPEIQQAFPDNELISCLAFVAASRTASGRVKHQAFGHLAMGNYPLGVSPRVKKLAKLFESGGIDVEVTEDVRTARWKKSIWNAAFNPVSVLIGGGDTYTMLDEPGGEKWIRQLMAEVVATGKALGCALSGEDIDANIANTRLMPAYKTSMALDYLNHRPMEVEAILGNVVRAAQNVGVEVTHLEGLYAMMKMVQARQEE